MDFARRQFFLFVAGAFLQPTVDRPKRNMLVRSVRPEDLEMPLSGFADYITPIEHFFVRSHVYAPRVNLNDWRLTIDGGVATPLTMTMEELKQLPAVELVSVLECAGNGRGFYEPSMPGLQWGHGGVGNGRWRGVRLADVLRRVGVNESAREILFNGADVPIGTMPDFQRSIPIKKALDTNTLLAFELNGEPLPVAHGFPLRVVSPGWAGDSWIKWLTVDFGPRQRARGVLDEARVPASRKTRSAGDGCPPRTDAAGHQPPCQERHRCATRWIARGRRQTGQNFRCGLER